MTTGADGPRVALIHAVAVAIDPVREAFAALWSEARPFNLLEDALSPDRERDSELAPALAARIVALGRYAREAGARGILYTCSAFGPAIEAFAREADVPVLKPNEAMFADALAQGRRVGLLATFAPSVASMVEEFETMARAQGSRAAIVPHCVPAALVALKAGDRATHDGLLADAAPRFAGADALMLAHFSTSRAYDAVRAVVDVPVLTAPRSAVLALRSRMKGAGGG